MVQKKRKETHTIERNMKDKQRVSRKHEERKKRKRKRQKQQMVSKMWSKWKVYNNGEEKVAFVQKEKQTNERNEKEGKVLW